MLSIAKMRRVSAWWKHWLGRSTHWVFGQLYQHFCQHYLLSTLWKLGCSCFFLCAKNTKQLRHWKVSINWSMGSTLQPQLQQAPLWSSRRTSFPKWRWDCLEGYHGRNTSWSGFSSIDATPYPHCKPSTFLFVLWCHSVAIFASSKGSWKQCWIPLYNLWSKGRWYTETWQENSCFQFFFSYVVILGWLILWWSAIDNLLTSQLRIISRARFVELHGESPICKIVGFDPASRWNCKQRRIFVVKLILKTLTFDLRSAGLHTETFLRNISWHHAYHIPRAGGRCFG